MPSAEEILRALFPRAVSATEDGGGLVRRSLAGTLDAASIPGRAYSSLWHRYDEPILQNMARTGATPGMSTATGVAEGMARDPLTLLSAPVGGLAGSGARAATAGLGALARRAIPVAADAVANAGLTAASQYGTEGRVDPRALALGVGAGLGLQGAGAAVSKMAPAARAKILDNPNFRRWFGDSKVVDEAGNPLVVYHGTTKEFDAFDPSKIGSNFGYDKKGFFFTDSKRSSRSYSMTKDEAKDMAFRMSKEGQAKADARTIAANVAINNPLTIADVVAHPAFQRKQYYDPIDFYDDNRQIISELFNSGKHDGAIFKIGGERIVVPLSPTQIKSATGNRGTFDPNDPNITHFAGGQSPIAGAQGLLGRYMRGVMNQRDEREKR